MEIPTEPKQVVEAALGFEEEGRKMLLDAEKSSVDPLSKATFQFLADQEIKHIETIKAFADYLEKSGEFDPNSLERQATGIDAKAEIKKIFERIRPEFEATAGSENERLEVYAAAMNMEHRGHDFYQHAASQTADPTARKLYTFLADEEGEHFRIIQDTRDFLRQPDAFMAIEEHWMTT
jgi:rubrerythrin